VKFTLDTTIIILLFTLAATTAMAQSSAELNKHNKSQNDLFLNRIQLPPHFHINHFANKIPNARSLAISKKGIVFVSTRSAGKIYALIDKTKNGIADTTIVLAKNLNVPNGIAYFNGNLYVAEINRILIFRNIENNLRLHHTPEVFYSKLPTESHHGWRYIRVGPDHKLYIAIGAPCNACIRKGYAKIKRLNLKTKELETIANGVRNSVGFDWHPTTKDFWFSDNGRDLLGDNIPADEINKLETVGDHFGFPYCHAGNIADPNHGKNKRCKQFRAPQVKLGAHVAPLGIRFYTGKSFPATYSKQLFIAEHGSWNRSKKVGYQISMVLFNKQGAPQVKPFATGWLHKEKTLGRPVDLLNMPDGSLLVSDDYRGVIYRITYKK